MSGSSITFVVPGLDKSVEVRATRGATSTPPLPGLPRGHIKHSVSVGVQRAAGEEVRISATPGEDVVVFQIAGGPSLMLHPESARDLMMAQSAQTRSAAPAEPGEVRVPVNLQWRGLEQATPARGAARGFFGDVLLSAVQVITGVAREKAADFVAAKVMERFDQHVRPGVYALNPQSLFLPRQGGEPLALVPVPNGSRMLVLLHGTFSDTNGTFSKLWTQHPQHVQALFQAYGGQVYTLEHETLGTSPIGNALRLVRALPQGARLHLVSHSRGGLVAEALARVCAPDDRGLEQAETLFAKPEYAAQLQELKDLVALAAQKRIVVERSARVGCPARGTLLASKRLDAYLSVFKWALELAGVPVAPELVEFIGDVVQHRANPMEMPGLAALMPNSPFVQWLHTVEERIPGELRVIAGDVQGDSVVSWLKTLLADSFFWTDSDFVVQTGSMYGGAPRRAGASFVLDQGGNVSHFSYFSNPRTAEAIVNALVQDAPQGFRTIGPLSWAGESPTGVRAALRGPGDGKPLNEKPAVFVLPGILGSNLKVDGKRVWLSWRLINGLKLLAYPGTPESVLPDGPIGSTYEDLERYLADTHEVIEFAFDWRLPIEEEARRLANAVTTALDARGTSGQPVRMLAHSMGGLLARTMQLEAPDVWSRMMLHRGARLLMLGTPNAGSWAPMQVLSGDDRFGNMLVTFGAPFQDHKARQLMAEFPGFIQLQAALLDSALNLNSSATWKKLAEDDLAKVREINWWHSQDIQLREYEWGVPSQDVLDKAVALRKRLDSQREENLPELKDKLLLVTGKAKFTPDGYEIGDKGLVYLDAQESGDGRVTLQSALLPGVRTWSLDCAHGDLPDEEDAFHAYRELLEKGTTQLLSLQPTEAVPATRGGATLAAIHVPSRPSRQRVVPRPPEIEREILSVPALDQAAAGAAPPRTALRISVMNGDLTYIRQPLLLGHYRSERLFGTEAAMNKLTGDVMQEALALGLYPDAPGSLQIFLNTVGDPENPWRLPRPEAVIVVGLGEEATLRPTDLVAGIRTAVIAWSQRVVEKSRDTIMPLEFELAATLIGSGGIVISAGQSAQLIAQGVREANDRLDERNRQRRATAASAAPGDVRVWPRVGHLQLIELYLDRAGEAWRALRVQAASALGFYTITDSIRTGPGALPRPLVTGYRGADYDLITALTQQREHGDNEIMYTLDTRRARAEVRAQALQGRLLRQFVESASNDRQTDPQIGRTLFKLLVPVEMEPFMGGSSELLMELDRGTAAIPWELLDTAHDGRGDAGPWAIRCKLLRRLRTDRFRVQVTDASADAHILIIGEPRCDTTRYPALPGARAEALAVYKRLTIAGAIDVPLVKRLVEDDPSRPGADSRTVINAIMERDWRIVHISGHGEPPQKIGKAPEKEGDPPQKYGDPRGVVLSDGTFLGPREIEGMRTVPELVFVNCCYLAARDAETVLREDDGSGLGRPYNRAEFASNVAEKLIDIGVRCVVAAGWAVDDRAAQVFATAFYDALLRGQRFMDAVCAAREAAYALRGNTWAAYQCYGDPDWRLRRNAGDAQTPHKPFTEEFSEVGSVPGLVLALETLAVRSKYQKAPAPEQQARIRHLESRFATRWGDVGEVAYAFGSAWSEAGSKSDAVEWYRRALAANDGSTPIKAAEQLGNLRVRLAWEKVDAKRKKGEALQDTLLTSARDEIRKHLAFLEQVTDLQPTIERSSLCGSAWKRIAMIETLGKRKSEEDHAIGKMRDHYRAAEDLARRSRDPGLFYPALNSLCAELALRAGATGELDRLRVAAVRESLDAKVHDDPEFWSVLGRTELQLYEALASNQLAASLGTIKQAYGELWNRAAAATDWSSAYDQLMFVMPRYREKAPDLEKSAADDLEKFVTELIKKNS